MSAPLPGQASAGKPSWSWVRETPPAPPHFPVNTLTLMRIATGVQMRQPQDFRRLCEALFGVMWRGPRNLGEPAELAQVLAQAGFDADAKLALVSQADVKARLIATTEEAVARGVFGAPSFFVGEQLFFGQDRLNFVSEALAEAA